jgi:cytochrome c oxidase subunit 2
LLCLQDSLCLTPTSTIKVNSNQWNWQRDFLGNCSDHLLDSDSLENVGSYDVPLILESNRYTRMLLSRTDVLHSLGVPSLSVKLDSIPGRINSSVVEVSSLGIFRGSCYELCGSGHRVIPIYLLSIY